MANAVETDAQKESRLIDAAYAAEAGRYKKLGSADSFRWSQHVHIAAA